MSRALLAILGLLLPALCLAETMVSPIVQLATKERFDDDPIVLGHDEYYTEVSPQLGFQVGSDTLQLKAWYTADLMYEAVAETPEVDHRAHFELNDKASDRLTLRSDVGIWRVSDPTSLPRLGVATVNAPVFYTLDKVGLTDALSPRWHWDMDYEVEAARIILAGSPLGVVQEPSTALRYAVTERTEVGLKDRYQLFTSYANPVGQADSVIGTLTHRLTESWTLKGEVGPTVYDDPQSHLTLIPHLQAELEHEGRYTEVGLVTGRDLVGAVGYAEAVWADYGQLAVAAHPLRDLKVYLVGGVFQNGFAPAAPVDVAGYSVAGGVTYNFSREVAADLSAIHIGQVAPNTFAAIDLNRDIASFQLAWTPAMESKHL